VVVKGLCCAQIQAGQFYRLQNFETLSPVVRNAPRRHACRWRARDDRAWVDRDQGLVSTICSRWWFIGLVRDAQDRGAGDLMGPTGARPISRRMKTVILIGGG